MAKLSEVIFGYATPREIRELSSSLKAPSSPPKHREEKRRVFCLFVLEGQNASDSCLVAPRTAEEVHLAKSEDVKRKEMYVTHFPHLSELNNCFVDKMANLEFKQGLTGRASKNQFLKLVSQNSPADLLRGNGTQRPSIRSNGKAKSYCTSEPQNSLRNLDRAIGQLTPDPLGARHG